MKRQLFLLVLTILSSVFLFAQNTNAANPKTTIESVNKTVTEQKAQIELLQGENENLKKQLNDLKEEVGIYRGDVRQSVSELHDDMSHWQTQLSTIITIITIVIGAIVPFLLNRFHDKRMEGILEKQGKELDTIKEAVKKSEEAAAAAGSSAPQKRPCRKAANSSPGRWSPSPSTAGSWTDVCRRTSFRQKNP